MRVLIVGATGCGGRSLVRQLTSLAPNAHLTAMSRAATALPGVARTMTGHYAGLIREPDIRRELAGLDAVVHLADGLSVLQHPPHCADEGLAARLVAASEALAIAVREAHVPLLVHVSSIKALCDAADDRLLVETSVSRATALYGRAKLRLEQRLADTLTGSDTRLAIVRNPVMYGAGKPGSMRRLLRLADTPLPLPLAGLANRRSLLAIDNFASALAAIVAAGADTCGGVYHVHDGAPLSITEIVETLRQALGRRRRLFAVGALAADLAARAPAVGPSMCRLYGSLELSDAHYRRCFKWSPVIDTREALHRMVAAAAGRG